MHIEKRKLKSLILFFITLTVFLFLYLPIVKAFKRDAFIGLQFVIIGLISAFGMVYSSRNRPFSLEMIFYFFVFAFLFCGGITQFATNTYKWGLIPSQADLEFTNLLIILFVIIFAWIRHTSFELTIRRCARELSFWNKAISTNFTHILPIIIVLAIWGFYTVLTSGWQVLLVRENFGSSGIASKISSSSLNSLIVTLVRGFTTWCMFLAARKFKDDRTASNFVLLLLMTFVCILNIPPMGVARYVMAAVYGGLGIYIFDFLKKGRILLYVLAFGLLVVFPLLNAFRGHYSNTISLELIQNSLGDISSNFTKADYDAYSMIVFSVQYVHRAGLSMGYQLLGALLFFIPSALWNGKPGGSGAAIIDYMDTGYDTNVSCPIIAEGYINFGIVGVILFAIVLGYITRIIDNAFWNKWVNTESPGTMFYSFLVLFFMFLCRGDLMSTSAYLFGYLLSLVILVKYLQIVN